MKAVLASGNRHKLEELAAALAGWELALLEGVELPAETGATYQENALAKARFGRSLRSGAWVLGEDSGIEVAALGGGPGIRSARWAEDPVEALLAALAGADDRRARYVCELVALSPAGEAVRGTGVLEGRVGEEARGSEGFGYDPIFVPAGERRTVAELGNAWKRVHSHRARAARDLLARLERRVA